jgi:UDP-N-acetylglucosamine/UDP-N-acetyl-alpha-D-glucosaminouronate 4-epimerase
VAAAVKRGACRLTSAEPTHIIWRLSVAFMATSSLFLVTGGAGFIGSHLVERLLADGHRVRVFDNFSTGSRANLAFARGHRRLQIVRGELANRTAVERAMAGVSIVLHQAAMRSVPRSVADPLGAHASNVTGTLHILHAAARQKKKPRVVYASSSSVYGERPELPKREDQPTAPISPYAASKVAGEIYASVWHRLFGVETVGLRYFNVFGPRQDPTSQYAAVVPRFIRAVLAGEPVTVYGDGEQSRDFTFVDNVVAANLLAADAPGVGGEILNVATGGSTTVNELADTIGRLLDRPVEKQYEPERAADVNASWADLGEARRLLGYEPKVELEEGLRRTADFLEETGD